jgi:hypothetical protein
VSPAAGSGELYSLWQSDLDWLYYGEVFESLKNRDLFKQVKDHLDTQTVAWPKGADFAPEY